MSDHRNIIFRLEFTQPKIEPKRRPRDTNWAFYKCNLANRLAHVKGKYGTNQDLDWTLEQVRAAMVWAYEINCPLKPVTQSNSTPWWNKTLEALRRKVRKAFNRAKKTRTPEGWNAYKGAQKAFKEGISKAKREKWQEFCSSMEGLADTAKLAKILAKDNDARLQCLKDRSGTYAETEEGTLELLLKANFPDFVREGDQINLGHSTEEDTRSTRDWETAAQVVTPEKVKWAINSFEPYKAPGPDGIFPKMLQKGCEVILGVTTGLLRG